MSDAADTARAAQLRAGIKLEGRVALVTGGSRGIGAAISVVASPPRAASSPPGTPPTASAPSSCSRSSSAAARGPASTTATWATPMTAGASSER